MAVKKIYCDQNSIRERLQFLQCVTPTDNDHKADWWNSEFGKQILFAQQAHIKALKQILKDCHTHSDVNNTFEIATNYPKWPPFIPLPYDSEKEIINRNHNFWTNGIGKTIRTEYQIMIQKFIDEINSLK